MVTINIIIIIKIIKKEEVFFLNWMEGAREEEKTDMVRLSIWDKNTEGHTI